MIWKIGPKKVKDAGAWSIHLNPQTDARIPGGLTSQIIADLSSGSMGGVKHGCALCGYRGQDMRTCPV